MLVPSEILKTGEILTVLFCGKECILYRLADGTVRLADAYCPHLGAHLGCGGKIVGDRIICPFHGWAFNVDGECVSIPSGKKISSPAQLALTPVQELAGFIMAFHVAESSSCRWDPPKLEEVTANGQPFVVVKTWDVKTHVQEVGENGYDTAHFSVLHKFFNISYANGSVEFDTQGPILSQRNLQSHSKLFGKTRSYIGDVTSYGLGTLVIKSRLEDTFKFEFTHLLFMTPIKDELTKVTIALSISKLKLPFISKFIQRKIFSDTIRAVEQDKMIWDNKIYQQLPLLPESDPIMIFRRWAQQFYPPT